MTRRYAEGTTTSVQKSKDELRALLKRYGATRIIDISDDDQGDAVQFEIRGRWLRFSAPKPDPESFRKYKPNRNAWHEQRRTDEEVVKKAEQEYMRRWRVLLLLVKAKFEAILDEGDSTSSTKGEDPMDFDREFLAYMLLPDGSTIGDHAKPELEEMYLGSGKPTVRALLGFSDTPQREEE